MDGHAGSDEWWGVLIDGYEVRVYRSIVVTIIIIMLL